MGAPGLGWVMMSVGIAWWVLVVIAIAWLIRAARNTGVGHGAGAGGAASARALLDDQFARGEVAVADYRERRRHLDTR